MIEAPKSTFPPHESRKTDESKFSILTFEHYFVECVGFLKIEFLKILLL